MLELKVFLFLLVNVLCQYKVASQYGPEASNGIDLDPCNARSLPENYQGSLVLCSPKSVTRRREEPAPIYEDLPFLPIPDPRSSDTQETSATISRPSSFVAAQQEIVNKDAEFAVYPKYSYNYGVVDGNTGDSKAAWEERDGDEVRGEYSVVEADGSIRTVSYTADDKRGFNAVVVKTKPTRITSESAVVQAFLPFPFYKRARLRANA